ncbi:MAG: hypothetical protein P1U40_04575 [Coxiellaceae bacterium]|nr:hypothetical protein [Coxiellaceae bacterium]
MRRSEIHGVVEPDEEIPNLLYVRDRAMRSAGHSPQWEDVDKGKYTVEILTAVMNPEGFVKKTPETLCLGQNKSSDSKYLLRLGLLYTMMNLGEPIPAFENLKTLLARVVELIRNPPRIPPVAEFGNFLDELGNIYNDLSPRMDALLPAQQAAIKAIFLMLESIKMELSKLPWVLRLTVNGEINKTDTLRDQFAALKHKVEQASEVESPIVSAVSASDDEDDDVFADACELKPSDSVPGDSAASQYAKKVRDIERQAKAEAGTGAPASAKQIKKLEQQVWRSRHPGAHHSRSRQSSFASTRSMASTAVSEASSPRTTASQAEFSLEDYKQGITKYIADRCKRGSHCGNTLFGGTAMAIKLMAANEFLKAINKGTPFLPAATALQRETYCKALMEVRWYKAGGKSGLFSAITAGAGSTVRFDKNATASENVNALLDHLRQQKAPYDEQSKALMA